MTDPASPANQGLLDPVLLRAFVAVADSGSFTRAAAATHLTQSTVSQQLKRLEQQMGYELLNRKGRYAVPTPEGERLLSYARNILALMLEAGSTMQRQRLLRLGVAEDFAGDTLMPVLLALRAQYPDLRLELSSGLSKPLYQGFREGELDLVLIKQRQAEHSARASWPEPLCWMAAKGWQFDSGQPLPLVSFPPGGLYRNEMGQLLDEAGIPWQLTYSSNSLEGVLCAVAAGLGVSLLPARLLRPGLHHEVQALPPALPMELALHLAPVAGPELQFLVREIQHHCDLLMAESAA
ncbi:LysR substrate-binding domain-containing protein [Shewanella sedimentimangrovi]|uniref:LysR family transcriptional regulator n=1 Tax=Shewanella sedimentimangrovi TaxID=2814293 RepID=A0ABX7R5C4_9GAMM|nr:LysR substrate-binding domain-containing protein [Shewanella sedimentimangrovi]QSX37986.1 LysR family transcriptional regulator [Shewanella sedimentimangrovi]